MSESMVKVQVVNLDNMLNFRFNIFVREYFCFEHLHILKYYHQNAL